ncbi:hypothetical protein V473_10880 [Sphingobium cupriresistens LL01]|uniref:Glycosyltransferase 2-like domain-containing protein n=2 Tax=Sphingobium cupriresistens TaxID=1132417 RepID=A0A0J7Y5C9_9SPHN|nr:hypothetical protein V473_10880 [Sphingobium cupriresistens LL01]
MDDASDDGTSDLVGEFEDERIRYYRSETRRGVAASRNAANELARGLYVAVHDDDDIMLPNRLSAQLDVLQAGDVGSYGGWVDFEGFNLALQAGKVPFSLASMLFNPAVLLHPTVLIRRDVAVRHKYFEDFESGSDYNWMARIAASGVHLRHCNHVLILRRIHDSNMTKYNSANQKVSSAVTSALLLNEMSSEQEKYLRHIGRETKPAELILDGLHEKVTALLPKSMHSIEDHLDKSTVPALYAVFDRKVRIAPEHRVVFHWHKMRGYTYNIIDLNDFVKTREISVDFYTPSEDRPFSIEDHVAITEEIGPNALVLRLNGRPDLNHDYFLPKGEVCLIWEKGESYFIAIPYILDMEMRAKSMKISKRFEILEAVSIKSEKSL